MKTIYFNCENGVSGDMVLNALAGLAQDPVSVKANIERVASLVEEKASGAHSQQELGIHSHEHGHTHTHGHEHTHSHTHANHHEHDHERDYHHDHEGHFQSHRSYREVMEIISSIPVSSRIKRTAEQIYAVIAKAESAVHGDPLETLHFHEVGRNQAIANALGVGVCMDALRADRVIISDVCDGHGTVKCAHGLLEVPVPAVRAMLDQCDLVYRQTDYEGEMVTPSGLAMLIGIGAKTGDKPEGTLVREAEARGQRSFGEHGLIARLVEE